MDLLTFISYFLVELAVLTQEDGKIVNTVYSAQEVDDLLAVVPIEKDEE